MAMDKTQLQWLLAGIGVIIVALIYLWGIRARLRDQIRNRRRRSSLVKEPKLGDTSPPVPEEIGEAHEFGELGRITPDHHLADKILVDVEIRPLNRGIDAERASPFEESSLERQPVSPPPTSGLWSVNLTPEPVPESIPASPPEPVLAPTPSEPIAKKERATETPPVLKTTIALTVMAPRYQLFRGTAIRAAAEEAGLRLSAAGLFERYPESESTSDTPVLSLAHLRKPGSFELGTLAELTTPGLLLFMSLPGPLDAMKALELLLLTVDRVARKLGGVICDENRHKLTNQGLSNLRDKVAELERSFRL